MPATPDQLLARFEALGIAQRTYEHPAVFTVEEAKALRGKLLENVLGVTPGSVTPFALINDRAHRVQPVLDEEMLRHDPLNYHPLVNTRTTAVAPADLLKFIGDCGHRPHVLSLEGLER